MKKLPVIALLLFLASPLFAAEDYLFQGANFLAAGNYHKAIRSYELAIKTNLDNAAAYKGLGLAYYRLGNYEIAYDVEMVAAAVNAFNKSLALKEDAEVCYYLGLSHLALYDKKAADTAYACLKSANSPLAAQLAEKISAYVKPAKFSYSSSTPRNDKTSVGIEGNTVIVPVTLSYHGRSVQARLVLDTGATATSISDRIAASLEVNPEDMGRGVAIVADGRTVGSRWFVADTLAVGPKSISQLRTAILPGSLEGVDGLLGMDFLKTVRYHVDFNRKVIEWDSR